uniref:Leucine-rich repeat-containing protein C10orf11-like n=1 Tax=Phallusia mammillata TaxID=59560 RepID=A0A6F9D8N2_9ASCI|nr:leucine-rich repeat-containing protein C10orf11-like [Phallusia mammillata]
MASKTELANFSDPVKNYSYTDNEADTVPTFLERHATEIEHLNLSHNKIRNLSGLEMFKNLEELNLDNNQIDDSTEFPTLLPLKTLTLNNNHISELEEFLEKLLAAFPRLTYVSLLGNEACPSDVLNPKCTKELYHQYRCIVAYKIPTLKFLDFKNVTDIERAVGYRICVHQVKTGDTPATEGHDTDPTYASDSNSSNRKVLLGRLRYTYVGKNSEGNRFIRNNDL